jgi:hypothetical protein
MAAVTLKAVATALSANAAAVGSAASLTTANVTALAALLDQLAVRRGEIAPVLKLLSDTNKAELYING